MRARARVLALAALLTITACGSPANKAAGPSSPTPVSPTATGASTATQPGTSTDIPALRSARLTGSVSVQALPFPLPGTTGYQTAVAFEAENPEDFAMVSPYRVTVRAGDKVLDTTDGSDRVVLAPHQRLLIVNEPSSVRGVPPDSATVTFYGNEAGMLELPDPAGWKLENVTGPNCNTGLVGCEVNADLSYEGQVSQDSAANLGVATVSVTFNRGDAVLLAGNLRVSAGASGPVVPGQTVPVTGYVVGDEAAAGIGLDLHFGVLVSPRLG